MHPCNISAPFDRTVTDITGPLLDSQRGNQHSLTAMDYFTKWPEVYTIANQKALMVDDVLVMKFFCHEVLLRELHKDQGWNFKS
jgi:hypothetical protein